MTTTETTTMPEIPVDQRALAERLGQALQSAGWTVATAESCTGGGIASAITEVPGSSAWFEYGFVTYANCAKVRMLGVSEQSLAQDGAVSEAVVREMAAGAIRVADADLAVAVSGVAGPDGGAAEKPVGTVWLGWARSEQGTLVTGARLLRLEGDRGQVRAQTVTAALTELEALVATRKTTV